MYKDKKVYVGFPILNRYDLLPLVFDGFCKSSIIPNEVIIVNNGLNKYLIEKVLMLHHYPFTTRIIQPEKNIGVAKAWNMIIKETQIERIIINDDVIMNSDTIKALLDTDGEIVACSKFSSLNAYSCFLIRDSCVEKVGYFDEEISPDYAYFEDNDYQYRLELNGIVMKRADCSAEHINGGSRTMNAYSPSQLQVHHMKFNYARNNYIEKWGGEPYHETYTEEYNGKRKI